MKKSLVVLLLLGGVFLWPYSAQAHCDTLNGPVVAAADKALETGTVDDLVKMVTEGVAHGIRDRFQDTLEKKKHAGESVTAGREFVEAYVPFTHYVERIYVAAEGTHGH